MTEAADAPQGGALSLDEAVALLDRRDADLSDGAADDETEFEGAASAPEEAGEWAEDPRDGEDETEAEELGEVDRPSPPKYWSKDAKARFAELDPDLQAVVLSQEGPREAAAARAKAEADGARRLAADLADLLPEAAQRFHAQWGGEPDWAAIAQAHGVEAMAGARAQYEGEKTRLAHAAQLSQVAQRLNHHAYVAAEFERLKSLDPELAHPETGSERRTEVTRYLHDKGLDADSLFQISALEMSLARKAMLWDQAQAKAARSNFTPRPDRPATRALARGGASAGPVDPKARRAVQAANRFAKSRSIEDAVALLNAQGD